jgi:hypothetical protein
MPVSKHIRKSKIIDEEITKIFVNHGEVKPSVVLREATPKGAPLHDFFEWDNKKASHEYRLIQSRRIIRVAMVEVAEGKESQLIHVPSIDISKEREGSYKPAHVIVQRVDEFTAAMSEASARLHSAQSAVRALDKAAKESAKADEALSLINIALQAIYTAKESLRAVSQ